MQDQPEEQPQVDNDDVFDDDDGLYAGQQEQQYDEQQHDDNMPDAQLEARKQQQNDVVHNQQNGMHEDQEQLDDGQPRQQHTGIVPRVSVQSSEAADDNLLSGLADAEDEDLPNTAGPPANQQQQQNSPTQRQQQQPPQQQQQEPPQDPSAAAAAAQGSTPAPDSETGDEPAAAVEHAAGAETGPKLNARQRRQQQRQAKLKAMAEAAAAGKPLENANGHAAEDKVCSCCSVQSSTFPCTYMQSESHIHKSTILKGMHCFRHPYRLPSSCIESCRCSP